jgi:hypothetical protein
MQLIFSHAVHLIFSQAISILLWYWCSSSCQTISVLATIHDELKNKPHYTTFGFMRIICIVHRGKMWKNVQRNPTKRHLLSSEMRTPSRPRRFGPSKRSLFWKCTTGGAKIRTRVLNTPRTAPIVSAEQTLCRRKKTHKSRTITAFA